MDLVKPMKRILFAIPAILTLLASSTPPAQAYEPPLEEIVARVLKDRSFYSKVIIETHSEVFDPMSQAGSGAAAAGAVVRIPGVGADETVPIRQEDRAFRQSTYWVRDMFLAVETFSLDDEPLHFYLREALRPISVNLTESRKFSDWDVLVPYLPFIEDNREDWLEGLGRWGLLPATVDLVRAPKGRILYRLMESPGKSVWIDRMHHLPVKINTRIEGGTQPLDITIEFGEFLLFQGEQDQQFEFPRTINYLLDGRLFKQTTVTGILVNPSWRRFPLTRLRKRGRELSERIAETSMPTGAQ